MEALYVILLVKGLYMEDTSRKVWQVPQLIFIYSAKVENGTHPGSIESLAPTFKQAYFAPS